MGIVGSGKSLIYLFTVSYGNGMSLRGEKENKIKQLGEWKPRRLNTNLMHLDAGLMKKDAHLFSEGWVPVHVHVYSFTQDVLVSQPGCAGSVLVTIHVRRGTKRSRFNFFFHSALVSCILQRGKVLKCSKALTCNIPCQGDVGGVNG